MKILELFSGYGTSSFALKRLGIPYEIVGYSDINKYANQCFKQNHGGKELGDVRKINPNDLLDFDLLTAGFPCQSFSNAGKMLGELDARGTLFYEIIRIAEVKQPKYMLLENVKGLTAEKFKGTFKKILSELDRIGYNVYWKLLNSKDYGIPQSRERIWFVCFRKDIDVPMRFQFPEPVKLNLFLKDILEDGVTDRDIAYCIDGNYFKGGNYEQYKKKARRQIVLTEFEKDGVLYDLSNPLNEKTRDVDKAIYIAQQLSIQEGKPVQLDILHLKHGEIRPLSTYIPQNLDVHRCIQAGEPNEVLIDGYKIRKLTPKECFRLMGFTDNEINLDGLSDTQKYKLAGNGQDVNMVSLIFSRMFSSLLIKPITQKECATK